jgi:hypothetical protein
LIKGKKQIAELSSTRFGLPPFSTSSRSSPSSSRTFPIPARLLPVETNATGLSGFGKPSHGGQELVHPTKPSFCLHQFNLFPVFLNLFISFSFHIPVNMGVAALNFSLMLSSTSAISNEPFSLPIWHRKHVKHQVAKLFLNFFKIVLKDGVRQFMSLLLLNDEGFPGFVFYPRDISPQLIHDLKQFCKLTQSFIHQQNF